MKKKDKTNYKLYIRNKFIATAWLKFVQKNEILKIFQRVRISIKLAQKKVVGKLKFMKAKRFIGLFF